MLTRIQASGYRCLKSVDQQLGAFCALIGPNASGKTTFLDVVAFMSDLMCRRGDVAAAVRERSVTFDKLLWRGEGQSFQLAIEAVIPDAIVAKMSDEKRSLSRLRYELEVSLVNGEIGLDHENLWLTEEVPQPEAHQVDLFPAPQTERPDIMLKSARGRRVAVRKNPTGNDNFYPDGAKQTYNPTFRLGRAKSALANLPADTESFPASTWFRQYLEEGVQKFVLNSEMIRRPSPPGLSTRFRTDGSNLPWVIAELRKETDQFAAWLDHVRTALPDIDDITTIERPEDKHAYLVIHYGNGAQVPSWLASDGTLRLLALTIPAYLRNVEGTFLIEEPENGIHPRALETVLQSLSSIYGGQVLLATHSPVTLNLVKPEQILCFAKDEQGATDIVDGAHHPALKEWHEGEPDLGILFASGILS
jgi:predicted ATPase